jgi:subtilisin family serine protease
LYPESFSVGAYSPSTGAIASFSSRGPVVFNGSRIGPDIAAPGVSTRSATMSSDTAYGFSSGTSMAGPHVAGVVALLWSARPELRGNVAWTHKILTQTARPTQQPTQTCGGVAGTVVPNNTWGHGKIDALAAINPTLAMTATLDSAPVAVDVTITDGTSTMELAISSSGVYNTTLPSGVYTATAELTGHDPIVAQVTITSGRTMGQLFAFTTATPMHVVFAPAVFKSE